MYLSPELNIDTVFNSKEPEFNIFNNTVSTNSTAINSNSTATPIMSSQNESHIFSEIFENPDKEVIKYFRFSDYFDFSFAIGIMFIIIAVFCFYLHKVLITNKRIQENQINLTSKNYDDFSEELINRESLNYVAYIAKTSASSNFNTNSLNSKENHIRNSVDTYTSTPKENQNQNPDKQSASSGNLRMKKNIGTVMMNNTGLKSNFKGFK